MSSNNYPSKEQGFFVKIREDFYTGSFDILNNARNEARRIGPDLKIYHGILKRISENIIDDNELYLISKVKNGKT